MQRLTRGRLRQRSLVPVVSVTLVALVAFDFAAVTALHSYLMNQTDTALRNAASIVRPELTELPAGGAVLDPQPDPNVPKQPPGAAIPGQPPPPGVERVVENQAGTEVDNELGTWVSTHQFIEGAYGVLFAPDSGTAIAVEDGTPAALDDGGPNVPVNTDGLVANGQPHDTVAAFGDPLRSVAVRTAHGTVLISISLDNLNSTVGRMWLIMIIGSAAVLLLVGLGVFWLL